MGLLSYIQPVGAALSLAKNLLKPDRAPEPPANFGFRAELDRRLAAAEKSAQATLQQFDANGDGYLTESELAMSSAEFARLDLNADGRLDLTELTRAQAHRQG